MTLYESFCCGNDGFGRSKIRRLLLEEDLLEGLRRREEPSPPYVKVAVELFDFEDDGIRGVRSLSSSSSLSLPFDALLGLRPTFSDDFKGFWNEGL